MGSKPKDKTLSATQASVKRAVAQGEEIANQLRQSSQEYKNLTAATQSQIENFIGITPKDFYAQQVAAFGPIPSVEDQIKRGQDWLSQDIPVLGSPSHQRFEQTLAKSADEYRRQLGMGLDEIQPRFAAIHRDSALNLQADPEAKKWSEGNLNMGHKALMTYNV